MKPPTSVPVRCPECGGDAVRETGAIIKSDGTPVEIVELQGTRGHLDGVIGIAQAGDAIRKFIEAE